LRLIENKTIIVFVIIFLIIGCSQPSDIEKDKFGGTLVYSASVSPTIIHPFLTFDSISVHIVPLIFNGLTKVAKDGSLVADLAESYEISQNGLEFDIRLRKGVRFHDEEELTSEDVKFTYEKIKEINEKNTASVFDYDFSMVKNIVLVNKYEVRITLEQPFAPFLFSLTVGILPKHIYQGKDDTTDKIFWYPIGTGPFKLTYIDKHKIILDRFDNYFRGKPYLDKIICEIYSSPLIWAKLLRGEIDYSRLVPINLIREIKNVNFLRTYHVLESSFYMLMLNCKKPFFRDKKTRQALNYAIDKESMIKKVLHGQGIACSSPFLPTSEAYNQNLYPYEYNPQKALTLLKAVGWVKKKDNGFLFKNKESFSFKCLLLSGYPNIREPATFIQNQLNEIGIKMEFKIIDTVKEFYKLVRNNDWDACFGGLEITPEPDKNYSYFHSSRINTTNYFNYNNPEIDRLLELGRKTMNKKERKKIYDKFQEVLYRDPPGIFSFYKYTSLALHKKIEDASADDFALFRGIEKWWIKKD